MSLVLIFESNRKWPKKAKTKIFRKNAYVRLSEAKCLETGQDSTGSPVGSFAIQFFYSFSPPNRKRSTISVSSILKAIVNLFSYEKSDLISA